MAVVTTPLGFQKPDGGESVRNGDDVLRVNADKAEQRFQEDRSRLGSIESINATQGTRLTAAELSIAATTSRVAAVESVNASQNVRLSSVESAAFVGGGLLTEDPADPGFYLAGAP